MPVGGFTKLAMRLVKGSSGSSCTVWPDHGIVFPGPVPGKPYAPSTGRGGQRRWERCTRKAAAKAVLETFPEDAQSGLGHQNRAPCAHRALGLRDHGQLLAEGSGQRWDRYQHGNHRLHKRRVGGVGTPNVGRASNPPTPGEKESIRQAIQGRDLVRRNIGDRLDHVRRNISDGGGGGGQTRRWAGDVDIRRWRCDRSDGHDAGPYERGASPNVRTLSFHVLAHPSTRCDDPTPHWNLPEDRPRCASPWTVRDRRELCWPLPRQCSSSLKRCRCRSRNLPPLVSAGIHFSACRVARALQSVSAEPRVDSFSDGSPARLEHHVVTDVGEEFCFGAICACRCAYFFRGDRAVTVGP